MKASTDTQDAFLKGLVYGAMVMMIIASITIFSILGSVTKFLDNTLEHKIEKLR